MKLKDFTTIKILYYYGKIFGFCPYSLNNEEFIEFSYPGAVYNIILAIGYTYSFCLVISNRLNLLLPRETALTILMDIFALTFQYLIVIISLLIFTFFQKRLIDIFRDFSKIDRFFRILKILILTDDSKKVKKIGMKFFYLNLLYYILITMDHLSLLYYKKFREQATNWLLFTIPKVVIYNVYMLFLELVIYLNDSFKALNKVLLRTFSRKKDIGSFSEFTDGPIILTEKLLVIGQCHQSLTDVLAKITNFFGFPLIFVILLFIINSFMDTYFIYHLIVYGKNWDVSEICSLMINLIYLLTKFFGIYFICSIPDYTCAEVNFSIIK